MTRKWSGILVIEGTETGDARYIVEGAIEWSDLPLPLGYEDGTMHGGSEVVTIGTIDTIERVGANIQATGQIDEDIPQGAELVRRMDAGTAPHGSEAYVSIDPDNWDMELVTTVPPDDSEEVIIVAAGEGRFVNWRTAAAGDGDPSQEPDAEVLYEDAAGDYVERYTRLRIRGATVVPIPAFDGAIISLDAASAGEPVAPASSVPANEAVAAAGFPVRPPAEWFEEPKELADEWTPYITVTEEGRVFGYIAPWDSCHIGFPEVCTTAPSSPSGYAYFRTGSVLPCDEDCAPIPTGPITIGTGHAPTKGITAMEAASHYDNTGSAIADVACGENVHGVWMAGALRPDASEAQIRVLRASTISGDWRSIGGSLELVAALGVNTPGFMGTRTLVASGKQTVLIGAGTDRAAKVLDPAEARWRAIESRLLAVERVTGPLKSHAMRELVASLRKAPAAELRPSRPNPVSVETL